MCYELKTPSGATEAVIDDNCGINKFYAIANALSSELKINFLSQVDDADSLDWDFKFGGQFLTLHYNIFNGVRIFPVKLKRQVKGDNAVKAVAKFLQQRAF